MCLSMNEYAVLDSIYHLSNNIKYFGWAIISRQKLADELDLSKRNIIYILDTLEQKGLIIRDEKTKFLRASDFYCKAMQDKNSWILANEKVDRLVSAKIAPLVQNDGINGENNALEEVQKLHSNGAKIAHNNNKDNNKDNNIEERKLKFASTLDTFRDTYPNNLIDDFIAYWSESNKSNTKFKYEMQKTWELERRLNTWVKNDKKFNFAKPKDNNNTPNTYREL